MEDYPFDEDEFINDAIHDAHEGYGEPPFDEYGGGGDYMEPPDEVEEAARGGGGTAPDVPSRHARPPSPAAGCSHRRRSRTA